MRRSIMGVVVAGLMCVAPAHAQSQAQMNRTAATDYRAADATMTQAWQAAYARMKARDAQDTSRGGGFGYAAATLASQRAWLRFRDAQCVIEGGEFAGGSLQAMTQVACMTRLTRERTLQLRRLGARR